MAWSTIKRTLEGSSSLLATVLDSFYNSTTQQCILYLAIGLASYLALARWLRFQRCRNLHRKYPYTTRESMSQMTDHDAWAIQKLILQMEFPFIVLKALQFALFRVCPNRIRMYEANPISQTYGIPTISATLLKTAQFSDPVTSFKRYADTGTLIGEFMAFDPRSDRAQTAIARTKWLHQGYRASGKILESDMLYTLSLFATEPIRFVERYEWRQMTEMERCAVGTYWKSLGDALEISYDVLPSGSTGFKDGLHWLAEVSAWSFEYEVTHMKPDPTTRDLADKVIEVLLYNLPGFIKPVGGYMVSWLMDERLRSAMMYVPMTPYSFIHPYSQD